MKKPWSVLCQVLLMWALCSCTGAISVTGNPDADGGDSGVDSQDAASASDDGSSPADGEFSLADEGAPSGDDGGGQTDGGTDSHDAGTDTNPGTWNWYRGNTHTHAQFSDSNDSDDTPMIAGWYRAAGYDFLTISEHNDHLAIKQIFCHDELSSTSFLMMCGLELSYSTHTLAFGINQYIMEETSLLDAVTRTLNAGGVPIANHPGDSGISASEFLGTTGLQHLEILNGGRTSDTPSHEALWDEILSNPNARLVYGVASDDNHYSESDVGIGWIMVRAPALTKTDILENFRSGNFYATNGIILNDYIVDKAAKTITIDSQNGNTITFIGNNGSTLQTFQAQTATYQVVGNEKYIRAKITNSSGKMAWTQPVWAADFTL